MASPIVHLSFLFLLLSQLRTFELSDQHFVNYSIEEEMATPYVLGNLITDLGLSETLINLSIPQHNAQTNHNKIQTLSIDLIASGTHQSIDPSFGLDYPKISFLPSNQWATKYFSIEYKSPLVQELVLYKVFDRDILCHHGNKNGDEINMGECYCSIDSCLDTQCAIILTTTLIYRKSESKMDIFYIRIEISDLNDNEPKFPGDSRSFVLHFKEDDPPGTAADLLVATDDDYCLNGLVTYTLQMFAEEDSNIFKLRSIPEQSKLMLVLLESLDRERQQHYKAYLLASDKSASGRLHTTTMTLKIEITDENDNYPVFIKNWLGQSPIYWINENVPKGYLVSRFEAKDADEGTNAEIRYLLVHKNEWTKMTLNIDPITGELRTNALIDREADTGLNGRYPLTIVVKDNGIPSRSSNLDIMIFIQDINDNPPRIALVESKQGKMDRLSSTALTEFSKQIWSNITAPKMSLYDPAKLLVDVHLNGEQKKNQIIATILSTDLDAGANGTVICHLGEQLLLRRGTTAPVPTRIVQLKALQFYHGSVASQIGNSAVSNSVSERESSGPSKNMAYALVLNENLHPNIYSNMLVRIYCSDRGTPPLQSERTFHLKLSNNTVFSESVQFEQLLLLSPSLDPFCQMRDTLGQFDNPVQQVVQIPSNGEVCLTSRNLLQPGEQLFQVSLGPSRSIVEYELGGTTKPDLNRFFRVETQTGIVSLCEETLPTDHYTNITVSIQATTSHNDVREKLKLRVTFESLKFSTMRMMHLTLFHQGVSQLIHSRKLKRSHTIQINESVRIGTKLFQDDYLGCTDPISDAIQECELEMVERIEADLVRIPARFRLRKAKSDSITKWIIFTSSPLDREHESRYQLEIGIMKLGGISHRALPAVLTLHVIILDDNDNSPVLHKPFELIENVRQQSGNERFSLPSEFLLNESNSIYVAWVNLSNQARPGHVILTVDATDNDLGQNSYLTYAITSAYSWNEETVAYYRGANFLYMNQQRRTLELGRYLGRDDLGRYVIKLTVSDQGELKQLSTIGYILLHITNSLLTHQQPINDLPVVSKPSSSNQAKEQKRAETMIPNTEFKTVTRQFNQYRFLVACSILLVLLCPLSSLVIIFLCRRRKMLTGNPNRRCIPGQIDAINLVPNGSLFENNLATISPMHASSKNSLDGFMMTPFMRPPSTACRTHNTTTSPLPTWTSMVRRNPEFSPDYPTSIQFEQTQQEFVPVEHIVTRPIGLSSPTCLSYPNRTRGQYDDCG